MPSVKNSLSWCEKYKMIWLCFILIGFSATCNAVLADSEDRINPTEIEKEVFHLINADRQKNSLPLLSWDTQLYDAARGHSEDMASENYFSHTGLNGREAIDRIRQAGYDEATSSEIIGAGQTNAQQIVDDWMTGNGLREDLLNGAYCDAAVSHTTNEESDWTDYWTLNIGRRNGIDQCPVIESEAESDLEEELAPEPKSTEDEPGFCEELIQRHENFCSKHPYLCRAALNKCKRSHEY